MPYVLKKIKNNCYKLCLKANPNKCISKQQAIKQEKAIIMSELKRHKSI